MLVSRIENEELYRLIFDEVVEDLDDMIFQDEEISVSEK